MLSQDDSDDPPIPQFLDEGLAPAVDESLVRALVRRELAPEVARDAYRFVYSFRSWNDVHTRLIVEEFHRREAEQPDEDSGQSSLIS